MNKEDSPSDFEQAKSFFLLGMENYQKELYEEAERFLYKSLQILPNRLSTLTNLFAVLMKLEKLELADEIISKAIASHPENEGLYFNRGLLLVKNKNWQMALASYDIAIEIKRDFAEAYSNRGNVLLEMGHLDSALENFEQAIKLKPEYAEAYYNRGNALKELRRLDAALESYEKAIDLKRDYAEAYSNRGNVLTALKGLDAALGSFDKAMEFKNDYAEAYYNRGNVLHELRQLDAALENYDKAIELKSDYAEAYNNRGNLLQELKRLDAALVSYGKALELNPDYKYLYGMQLYTKMLICDWDNFESNVKELSARIKDKKKSSPSFPLLSLTDSSSVQRQAAEIWINDQYPLNLSLGAKLNCISQDRIKIGYFSADLREHPVSYLTAEFFELHDKSRFELIAFYSGPADSSKMHQRVSSCFEKFIDIRAMVDRDVAQMSRDMGIDIAIDLTGLTHGGRIGIFSHRAAPIQINYLGYSGTMGAVYYDYIIGDKTIIPTDRQKDYVEKIIYLPYCFLPHDSSQKISSKVFSKTVCGLPDDGFVFCCFNASYKMNPIIFDSWMRILRSTGNSVLWLSAQNDFVINNLRKEAEKRGVNSSRLIYASRTDLVEDHLARHSLADLFIDTLPYNAHTTVLDALWAGLPVLTCMGESFAGRVAASALNAIELPELVTTTRAQYEAAAIELANNPTKLKVIKEKLKRNRLNTALFDSVRFTRNFEKAYVQVYARYQAELAADNIYIQD